MLELDKCGGTGRFYLVNRVPYSDEEIKFVVKHTGKTLSKVHCDSIQTSASNLNRVLAAQHSCVCFPPLARKAHGVIGFQLCEESRRDVFGHLSRLVLPTRVGCCAIIGKVTFESQGEGDCIRHPTLDRNDKSPRHPVRPTPSLLQPDGP